MVLKRKCPSLDARASINEAIIEAIIVHAAFTIALRCRMRARFR